MKKINVKSSLAETQDVLTRAQLRNVLGGSAFQQTGSGCQTNGASCDTYLAINCCSGLKCGDYKCGVATR